MKILLALVLAIPLLAEDAPTVENGKLRVGDGCGGNAECSKKVDEVVSKIEQQLAAKDAEIAQLRQWGQACIAHVQKDMALINGFLGPLDQMPQPTMPTVARPPKRESKP